MNQRPSGYEPDELPTALLRDILNFLTFLLLITRTGYLSFGKPPCSIQKLLRTFVLALFDCYGISPSPSSAIGSGSDKSQRATNRTIFAIYYLLISLQLLNYNTTRKKSQPFFILF